MIAGPLSEDTKDPKMLQFSLLTTKQEGWQLAKKTLCGSVHPSARTDGENQRVKDQHEPATQLQTVGQSKYPHNRSADSCYNRRAVCDIYLFFNKPCLFNLYLLTKGQESLLHRISMCLTFTALLKLQSSDWPIALGRTGSRSGWWMCSGTGLSLWEINDICLIIG